MSSNIAAAVSYVLTAASGLFMLLSDRYKDDKDVRFHAFQAVLFYIAALTVWIAYWAVTEVISFFTLGIGGLVLAILSVLVWGVLFLYWLFLMYKAYNNERYEIPYLGRIAAQAAETPRLSQGVANVLAYVLWFISGIVMLVAGPFQKDKTVRFHAWQSIFYSVLCLVVAIGWALVHSMFLFAHLWTVDEIAGFGWLAIRLVLFAGWLLLMQKAYEGSRLEIPVLAKIAAKQAEK